MGKKINKYSNDSTVDINDRLLGSNSEGGKTKNYPVRDIIALNDVRYFPVLLSFKYAASSSSYNETTSGYFTSDFDDTSLVTTLKVNKTNVSGDDITNYLRTLEAQIASNAFELNIKSTDTTTDYFKFSIYTVTEELQYFTIGGAVVPGSANGDLTDEDSYLMPDTKTSSILGAVASVTGDGVDNTDPINPVITEVGTVASVTGTAVDNTDPDNPVINITAGTVESVTGNLVDNTDPDNPIVTGVASVTGTGVDNSDPTNPVITVSGSDPVDITWSALVALAGKKNGDRFNLTDRKNATYPNPMGFITLDNETTFTYRHASGIEEVVDIN